MAIAASSLFIAVGPAGAETLQGHSEIITATDRGQDYLTEALQRFDTTMGGADQGLGARTHAQAVPAIDGSSYDVVENLEGDPGAVWVIPADSPRPAIVTEPNGRISITATSTAPAEAHLGLRDAQGRGVAASSLYWYTPYCYARYSPGVELGSQYGGWSDMCGQWGILQGHNDANYDHYVYKLFATCGPNANWLIRECGVGTKQDPSLSEQPLWTDWAPKADTSGGCRSVNMGLTLFGVSVAGDFQSCEENDITKQAAAPGFTSVWKFGGSTGATSGERTSGQQLGLKWKHGSPAQVALQQWIETRKPR